MSKINKKKYFDELNIFRALVILLVTLGHSTIAFTDYSSFSLTGLLYGYAYSFHMPALFLLSGMLFSGKFTESKSIKQKSEITLNRFERLMIPYFFYTAVSFVLKLFMQRYAFNPVQTSVKTFVDILFGVNNPNGGLWFLNTLFFITLISLLINRIDIRISTVAALILSIITEFTPWLKFEYTKNITIYLVYFLLGILISTKCNYDKISEKFSKIKNKNLLSIITAICLVLSVTITYLNLFIIDSKILVFVIRFFNIFTFYLVACAISVNSTHTKKLTMMIGNYGMDIYMLGYYIQIAIRVVFYTILGLNIYICSFAMFIFPIFITIPISKYIVRKFKITRAVMLGDFKTLKGKVKNEKA